MAINSATACHLGEIQNSWVNTVERIEHLFCDQEFIPLLQVVGVNTQSVLNEVWQYSRRQIL